MTMTLRLLRLPNVLAVTGDARSTHYNKIDHGLMTPPVSTGLRSVAWPEHEIGTINAAYIAGKSRAEIRSLVRDLVARRKGGEAELFGENAYVR